MVRYMVAMAYVDPTCFLRLKLDNRLPSICDFDLVLGPKSRDDYLVNKTSVRNSASFQPRGVLDLPLMVL